MKRAFLTLFLALTLCAIADGGVTTRAVANIGSPPDDAGLLLPGTLYIPDATAHPPPWHCMVGTRAGGFTDGGLANLVKPFTALANAGYLCLAFECRLAKNGSKGGLVGDPKYGTGQTTTGHWHQQTDDVKRAIRYMRKGGPIETVQGFSVTGFVGALGGSGSAHHALYCALDGTVGDDKSDASICMSPPTDFSDRTNPTDQNMIAFIGKVTLYGDSTDLTVLRSKSPIALPLAMGSPTLRYNGDAENMPLPQKTNMDAAMTAAGATRDTSVLNTGDCGGLFAGCGSVHAFGIWDFRGPEATTWLNARASEWAAAPSPTPTATPTPTPTPTPMMIMSPHGIIGGGQATYTNPHAAGRFKKYFWTNLQPDNTIKSVTGVASTDIITSNAHGYANDDPIVLLTVTGGAGLIVGTQYYVRDVTSNTFKIAASAGGTAINFTTDISAGTFIGYSWNDIDSELADATANGKQFTLLLCLNSGDPGNSLQPNHGLPGWLTCQPGQTENCATAYGILNDNHGALLYQYLSWDTGFQHSALNLIAAIGDRYDGKFASISMGGIGSTTEMHEPDTFPDGKSVSEAADAYVAACNIIIAGYAAHFKKTTFVAALALPFIEPYGTNSLNAIVNTSLSLYGNHIGFENWGLNATSSQLFLPNKIIYDHRLTNPVGFQMTGNETTCGGGNLCGNGTLRDFCHGNGTDNCLRAAMDAGVALGAQYLQVFGDDMANPVYFPDFDAVAPQLLPPPNATPTPTPTATPTPTPMQIPTKLLRVTHP